MNSERIKEIQLQTAYPESLSVHKALLQVWNECEQDKKMYSDEDLAEAFEAGKKVGEDNACMAENYRREDFKEWFEQFKKK